MQEPITRAELVTLIEKYRVAEPGRAQVLAGVLALELPDGREVVLAESEIPSAVGPQTAFALEASRKMDAERRAGAEPGSTAAPTNPDLGDRVVEILKARDEGRKPAAWARSQPAPQQKPEGDLGDQVVAIMRKKGMG